MLVQGNGVVVPGPNLRHVLYRKRQVIRIEMFVVFWYMLIS